MSSSCAGSRPLHADALESVPIAYLPTGGLVDSLNACVDDPSACCRVRLTDHLQLADLVGEPVADLKLHRKDFGGGLCGFALLFGAWLSHTDSVARGEDFRFILWAARPYVNLKVADVIDHVRRDYLELRECAASKSVRSHPVPVALVGECSIPVVWNVARQPRSSY
jgi:hypothetical protein